jgi:glyoxylase-like metal-dependent hydrolase (beta-lactamase superfamily II)
VRQPATGPARSVAPVTDRLWQLRLPFPSGVPLNLHAVTGPQGAVLVDAGLAGDADDVLRLLAAAGVPAAEVDAILVTHAHHDHVGALRPLLAATGAQIHVPAGAQRWLLDPESHLDEFALHEPALVGPDHDAVREVRGTIAGPVPAHALTGRTGGEWVQPAVLALDAAGHATEELAYWLPSERTLILGDALICLDWDFFHGYLDPVALAETLRRLCRFVATAPVAQVCAAHRPVLSRREFVECAGAVRAHIDEVDSAVLTGVLRRGRQGASLADVWRSVSESFGKTPEFRGLAMVKAHLRRLVQDGRLVRQAGAYRPG